MPTPYPPRDNRPNRRDTPTWSDVKLGCEVTEKIADLIPAGSYVYRMNDDEVRAYRVSSVCRAATPVAALAGCEPYNSTTLTALIAERDKRPLRLLTYPGGVLGGTRLDLLPVGSVVTDSQGDLWTRVELTYAGSPLRGWAYTYDTDRDELTRDTSPEGVVALTTYAFMTRWSPIRANGVLPGFHPTPDVRDDRVVTSFEAGTFGDDLGPAVVSAPAGQYVDSDPDADDEVAVDPDGVCRVVGSRVAEDTDDVDLDALDRAVSAALDAACGHLLGEADDVEVRIRRDTDGEVDMTVTTTEKVEG